MIDALLGFQNENGGFGLFDNKSTGVDMTAMILQALAPYVKEAKVQTAVDKAFIYLKDAMDEEYAYTSSESAAQVILALALPETGCRGCRFCSRIKRYLLNA